MVRNVLGLAALVALGWVAFLVGKGSVARPIAATTADAVVLYRDRPVAGPVSLGEKIATGAVRPTQVVRGRERDTTIVNLYCAPAKVPIARGPTTVTPPPVLPPWSMRADRRLRIWSVLGDGTPSYFDLPIRTSRPWSVVTSGDSVVVRQQRWLWWAARRCAIGAGLGLGLGLAAGGSLEQAATVGAPLGCGVRVALP